MSYDTELDQRRQELRAIGALVDPAFGPHDDLATVLPLVRQAVASCGNGLIQAQTRADELQRQLAACYAAAELDPGLDLVAWITSKRHECVALRARVATQLPQLAPFALQVLAHQLQLAEYALQALNGELGED